MNRIAVLVGGLLTAALAACGGDPTTGDDVSYHTDTAVLAFHGDWRIEQTGQLREGGAVRFEYDAERLTECRGDFQGQPGWTITGYHSLDGAEPTSFHVAGFSAVAEPPAPLLTLDRPGDLAVWFHNTSRWGCSAYDSNFGTNFHFQVLGHGSAPDPEARATIRFDADWNTTVEGALRRGGQLRVDYEPERLDECRGEQYGTPAWTITGYYRFGDAEPESFYVAGHSASGQVDPPVISLEQTGELAIWFHNTNRWGCSAYDSNQGADYRLDVE